MTIKEKLTLLHTEVAGLEKEMAVTDNGGLFLDLLRRQANIQQDIGILKQFESTKADDLPSCEARLREGLPTLKADYERAQNALATASAELAMLERLKQLLV